MTDFSPLLPRQKVPALHVGLTSGASFNLANEKPQHFSLLVFYRGLHCPICRGQLKDLEAKLDEFDKRGVSVVAVSTDTAERAEKATADWGLAKLRVGHGLDLATARLWGLYLSTGRGVTPVGIEEPALFSEPGLFLVMPEGTLYFASVQTMPFARPHFADILSAIDLVLAKNYPARGEVASLARAAA